MPLPCATPPPASTPTDPAPPPMRSSRPCDSTLTLVRVRAGWPAVAASLRSPRPRSTTHAPSRARACTPTAAIHQSRQRCPLKPSLPPASTAGAVSVIVAGASVCRRQLRPWLGPGRCLLPSPALPVQGLGGGGTRKRTGPSPFKLSINWCALATRQPYRVPLYHPVTHFRRKWDQSLMRIDNLLQQLCDELAKQEEIVYGAGSSIIKESENQLVEVSYKADESLIDEYYTQLESEMFGAGAIALQQFSVIHFGKALLEELGKLSEASDAAKLEGLKLGFSTLHKGGGKGPTIDGLKGT
ncbi:hypothetical protein Taro_015049 [Colocasia esculenta]|uniref:Uncharacterized protein n=1 Tax=Colocasia esculenta TaxID=4460 RepID=A0A843UL81_COLES|nr:hypothetical protein [Colocasia esculenta]